MNLTLIDMSSENKKKRHLGAIFISLNELCLAGCQINKIDINFHLQKSLEIFDRNSADKIQSQNYKEGKSALPHAN